LYFRDHLSVANGGTTELDIPNGSEYGALGFSVLEGVRDVGDDHGNEMCMSKCKKTGFREI
jgi:hypothetical protein